MASRPVAHPAPPSRTHTHPPRPASRPRHPQRQLPVHPRPAGRGSAHGTRTAGRQARGGYGRAGMDAASPCLQDMRPFGWCFATSTTARHHGRCARGSVWKARRRIAGRIPLCWPMPWRETRRPAPMSLQAITITGSDGNSRGCSCCEHPCPAGQQTGSQKPAGHASPAETATAGGALHCRHPHGASGPRACARARVSRRGGRHAGHGPWRP